MERTATQVHGISPEDLTQKILSEVEKKLTEFEKRINIQKTEKYISRKETSQKLGVTYATLNSWDKKGVLAKRKIGNRVLYVVSEIDEILESSK
ncbi:MerR family transcriptional regulator [Flavobacteriaceae bacterium 3-367]